MQLLPLVDTARGCVALVPISDASAVLLARILLQGHSTELGPHPLSDQAKTQLAVDPPLAVWVLWNAQRQDAPSPETTADAAQWLCQNAWRLLDFGLIAEWRQGEDRPGPAGPECPQRLGTGGASARPALPEAPAEIPPLQAERLADLVAHRVALAEWAARLTIGQGAAPPGGPEEAAQPAPSQPEAPHHARAGRATAASDDAARLAGLVFAPDAWNLGPGPTDKLAISVPAPAAAAVSQAIALLEDQAWPSESKPTFGTIGAMAEAARGRWLSAIPGTHGLLAALAQRLASLERLRSLEQEFSARLESEKLAALAEFAAGAGHEINNPLANISGRAQLLLQSEPDPERRRELATIVAQAHRAHQMIADLWLFARPPQPQFRRIDLVELVRQAVAQSAPVAAERSVELVCSGSRGPLWIEADPVQLHVAVAALVNNALEAIGHTGRVEVVVDAGGDQAAIRVTDSGPGIAPEHRPHLFEPFFSGRQAGRGLGLGLSKAWQVVRSHGGRIDVAPMSCGASLAIVLPIPACSGAKDPPQ